jgi:hypothetical protein
MLSVMRWKACVHLLRYSFISENSRKAKYVKHLYDQLRSKVRREDWVATADWENIHGHDGIPVPQNDKTRALNLRLQDEHLSPYMKTDMNLFQMHMLDETVKIVIFRAQNGWLLTYEGVSEGPQPFGQNGYDTR